jgi:parallel beta-helix repeat protein
MCLIKRIVYLPLSIVIISYASLEATSSYYIAKDGKDYENDGSITEPWRTFDYALANSQPGDTISIRQGSYHSDLWIRGDFGGVVESLKTIMAYPGEEVILEETSIMIYVDYVCIQGFILNQTKIGIYADHMEIFNNHINRNSGTAAIYFSYGIYFLGGSHNIFRDNIIKGFTDIGIFIYDEFATTEDIVIKNNYISNSKFRSGICACSHTRSRIENIIISNNVIVDNAEFGIELGNTIKNAKIFNNTLI